MMGCGSSRDIIPRSPFKNQPGVYQVEGGGDTSLKSNQTLKNLIKHPKDSTVTQIDIIEWNKLKTENSENSSPEVEPEIISLHKSVGKHLNLNLKRNSECQTDPVNDESVIFDWDLSDRTDIGQVPH